MVTAAQLQPPSEIQQALCFYWSFQVHTESAHLSEKSTNSRKQDQMGNKKCNCITLNQSRALPIEGKNELVIWLYRLFINVEFHFKNV